MLTHLTIDNIVLIDHLSLPLSKGLTALTGETGAGKSILLDSLSLALGRRAETRLVRQGADKARVTAQFTLNDTQCRRLNTLLETQDLNNLGDNQLILRRSLSSDGKSRAFVNDQPVSQSFLQHLGQDLVEIHGQFDTHGLLDPTTHIDVLDNFGNYKPLLTKVSQTFQQLTSLRQQYRATQAAVDKAQRDEEYLRFTLDELEKLAPEENEEDSLTAKRSLYMHAEKLIEALQTASNALYNGQDNARDHLNRALATLERVSDKAEGKLEASITPLNRAIIEMDEGIEALADLQRDLDFNPQEQASIDERLFALRDAARKHRCTVNELPAKLDALRIQLSQLETATDDFAKLEKQLKTAEETYLQHARALHQERQATAQNLCDAVHIELPDLKLAKAQLRVNLQERPPEQWQENGLSDVFFEVATNTGHDFGPLHKVASGGELARLMLALKVVLNQQSSFSTLVFDEVDTGIGGATADAVGQRLSRLAQSQQVLVVTHSPQVAAHAAQHLTVTKAIDDDLTTTQVTPLGHTERIEELARMLAGAEITPEARQAAATLLDKNSAEAA